PGATSSTSSPGASGITASSAGASTGRWSTRASATSSRSTTAREAGERAMTKPVTPQEMFDLWQKMVNPSAYPLQSLMFPVMDPKELQKKIAELHVVEHWLRANLQMLQLTIQSLEFQK